MDPKLPDLNRRARIDDGIRQRLPTAEQRPIYRWSISRRQFVATVGLLTGGVVMGFPIHGSGATVTEVEQPTAEAGAVPL
ncbi:MAG: hypothetical protein WA672_10185, partial [Candidatus Angelobacter sp.]